METNFGHFLTVMHILCVCCKDDHWGRKAVLSVQRKSFNGAAGKKNGATGPKRLDTSQRKRPTVVGPARLGKRFPKSEYRKLERWGRSVPTPERQISVLLRVSCDVESCCKPSSLGVVSAIYLLNIGYCGSRHVDRDRKCECNLQSCLWCNWIFRRVPLRLVMGDGGDRFRRWPS